MHRVVLDTCVLVPGLQRDFLLQLAAQGAYTPLWSSGTLDELDYVLARLDERAQRHHFRANRRRLIETMVNVFPGSTIEAPRDENYSYELIDSKDAHVIHAAVAGAAAMIVTDDLRAGFDASPVVHRLQISVLTPRTFTAEVATGNASASLAAIHAIAQRKKSPPMTDQEVVDALRERCEFVELADLLEPWL